MSDWDTAVWLRNKIKGLINSSQDKILERLQNIQNLFEASSEADFRPEELLEGKKAFNGTVLQTGTMPNNGMQTATLAAGGTYTIEEGYHNGYGKITAKDLASQTAGTATEPDILISKTAWVNGAKKTGTMANNGAKTATLAAGGTYVIEKGYHNGNGKITAKDLASQTPGTAAEPDMLINKIAWVNGAKKIGTMAEYASTTLAADTIVDGGDSALISVPAVGHYNTSSKVQVTVDDLKDNVAKLNDKSPVLLANSTKKSGHTNGVMTASGSYTFTKAYNRVIVVAAGVNGLKEQTDDGDAIHSFGGTAKYTGSGECTTLSAQVLYIRDVQKGDTVTGTHTYTNTRGGEIQCGIRFVVIAS